MVKKGSVKKKKSKKTKPLPRLISIPAKLFLAGFITYLIGLTYFLLISYIEPRSIDFVTNKANQILQQNLQMDLNIDSNSISFQKDGNLRISLFNLKKNNSDSKLKNIENLRISQIDFDIPLFRLLLFNFNPKKLYLRDSEVILNYENVTTDIKPVKQQKEELVKKVDDLINLILATNIPIKNLYIDDLKLIFNKNDNSKKSVLIKYSNIDFERNRKIIRIASNNDVIFENTKIDAKFNFNCFVNLKESKYPVCNFFINNIRPDSVAEINDNLKFLAKIDSLIDLKLFFKFNKSGLNDIGFKLISKKGSFYYDNFFSKKIIFEDLTAHGAYHINSYTLNIADIKAKFLSDLDPDHPFYSNPQFNMSLIISGFNDSKKELKYNIKLQDVPNDEIDKYWPSGLPGKNIRSWVINKFDSGLIKNAFASFVVLYEDGKSHLESIESEVDFVDFNLTYDDYFPSIKNISGVANFDKKGMTIFANSGDLLDSKLVEANIAIDDFLDENKMLKIRGKAAGPPQDLLKHIDYKSKYTQNISDYINGDAISDIIIDLPIKDKINLEDVLIKVSSKINNLNNDFIVGFADINCDKSINSNIFEAKINLSNSKLIVPAFGIEKEPNVNSNLTFKISSDDKSLFINDISLTKIKDLTQFGGKYQKSEISGNIIIDRSDKTLSKAILRNHNFGKNNFLFSYRNIDGNVIYDLSGTKFDVAGLINNKLPQKYANKIYIKNSKFSFDITNAYLSNDKFLNNLFVDVRCYANFCSQGLIKANYSDNKFLEIKIKQDLGKDFANIDAKINDAGYLAEGLGITNLLQNGNIEIIAKNKMVEGFNNIEGKLKISDKITFFETEKFKQLANDSLFSQVRDIIFAKGKTIFDNIDSDFILSNGKITINSFVANNLKVGVTAKGIINIESRSFDIKGMIVPGFIVNNLFGIGKIPIVGNVVSGLLTGGDEGGGLFGIRYSFVKESAASQEKFQTEKIKSFVPSSLKNLFDLI